MTNFVQDGKHLEVAAPSGGVSSGDGFIIGSLFLVAVVDALASEQLNAASMGVFNLKKLTSDSVSVGDKLNWNDSNKELQLATTDLDNVATATKAASGSVSVVECMLTSV